MDAVQGRNVTKATSSTPDLTYCQPCSEDGKKIIPNAFCPVCNEFLCSTCARVHRNMKLTKSHDLKDRISMPSLFCAESEDETFTEACRSHAKERIKYFCPRHGVLLCGDCIVENEGRRSCKVEKIHQLAKQYKMGAEYNSLKTGLDLSVIDIKNYLSSIQASMKSVDEENLTIINEVRKFRTEINQYLDKREKELLEEIEQKKRKSMTLLIKLEANCQEMESATEKLRSELQAQENNCNQLFVSGTRALKELVNLRSGLDNIREESSIPYFKFSRDPASEQFLVSSTAFGTVDQLVPLSADQHKQLQGPGNQHIPDNLQKDRPNETGKPVDTQTNKMVFKKGDEIVIETFYHRSGKEFQCVYQTGMRFYFDDWGNKDLQPFPKRWYNEGLLVTNTILKDDSQTGKSVEQRAGASSQGQSSKSQGRKSGAYDRVGFLMHPTRGGIPTYIFYKKHNVHMYFDKNTGSWVRMPIAWELQHSKVKRLVDQVNISVPTWSDHHDILSMLRACNYDPDECISIYLNLQKDQWMNGQKTGE